MGSGEESRIWGTEDSRNWRRGGVRRGVPVETERLSAAEPPTDGSGDRLSASAIGKRRVGGGRSRWCWW